MVGQSSDRLQTRVHALTRRELGRQAAGASALAATGIATRVGSVRAQYDDETTVGVAEDDGIGIEFVGTVYQNAFNFTISGFLTYVAGLDANLLFTDDDAINRSAATARLTFYGTGKGISRTVVEPLFIVDAAGEFGIYFNEEGGGALDNPDSLAQGEQIATIQMRIQNAINVTAPKSGLCTGYGDLIIGDTTSFEVSGDSFVIGEKDDQAQLNYSGQGVLLNPALPEALITIAGNFRF